MPLTTTTIPRVSALHVSDALRCPCGRIFRPHDFDATEGGVIRLICRCHRLLLEVELGDGSGSEGELAS
jgi:hypothetical protein